MRKITIMMMLCLGTTSIYAHQANEKINSIEQNVVSDMSSHRGRSIEWYDDWGDGDDDAPKWFVTVGTDVYARTRLWVEMLGVSVTEKYHDTFSGYAIGAGRDWGVVSLGAYMTAFDIDEARIQNVTARATMDIFPIENLPYIAAELGMAQINSDLLVERAFSYGWGLGWRMELIEGVFVDITGIYNRARFRFDFVDDVPMRLDAGRWTVMLGVGIAF